MSSPLADVTRPDGVYLEDYKSFPQGEELENANWFLDTLEDPTAYDNHQLAINRERRLELVPNDQYEQFCINNLEEPNNNRAIQREDVQEQMKNNFSTQQIEDHTRHYQRSFGQNPANYVELISRQTRQLQEALDPISFNKIFTLHKVKQIFCFPHLNLDRIREPQVSKWTLIHRPTDRLKTMGTNLTRIFQSLRLANDIDPNLRIGDRTILEYQKYLCRSINAVISTYAQTVNPTPFLASCFPFVVCTIVSGAFFQLIRFYLHSE